jgi:carbon starvation protein
MLAGIIVYGLVYQFYVKWFDRKVIQSDPSRPTPAHVYMDGVEFFPSNKYVMLGWHWKSIAALGPVTGPALAIVWGWLPGLLWILIGNSLLGWLHDYNSMVSSVRNEGASLGPLTHQIVGSRARKVLVAFLAFYSILIFAAFLGALLPIVKNPAVGGAAAMVSFAVLALIGVASGFAIFKAKINVVAVTALSLVGVAVAVYLSQAVFGSQINAAFTRAIPDTALQEDVLLVGMLVFSFLGAVLPLWGFAMPINYLGFYVAYFVVAAIVGSSFVAPQTFTRPMFTNWFSPVAIGAGTGLINSVAFPLWPLLFVTIACGACSGWHGLIGSSLSSKQLDNESDAHFVGGGGMLLEGILGLTSVVAVAALKSTKGCSGALGLYVCGGAQYLSNIGISSVVGTGIMALMVLVLGLTLTQLALRFARLAVSEMVRIPALKNIYLTSIVVAIITYVLTSSRFGAPWGFIWTLFGGSNQLLAGVTLLVTTLWLAKMRRQTLFTGIPAIFMMGTTIAALGYTAYATLYIAATTNITTAALAQRAYGSAVAGVIAIILTALGELLAYDGFRSYRIIRAGPITLTSSSITTGVARASGSEATKLTVSAPNDPTKTQQNLVSS